jgi:hypothetical protein
MAKRYPVAEITLQGLNKLGRIAGRMWGAGASRRIDSEDGVVNDDNWDDEICVLMLHGVRVFALKLTSQVVG